MNASARAYASSAAMSVSFTSVGETDRKCVSSVSCVGCSIPHSAARWAPASSPHSASHCSNRLRSISVWRVVRVGRPGALLTGGGGAFPAGALPAASASVGACGRLRALAVELAERARVELRPRRGPGARAERTDFSDSESESPPAMFLYNFLNPVSLLSQREINSQIFNHKHILPVSLERRLALLFVTWQVIHMPLRSFFKKTK